MATIYLYTIVAVLATSLISLIGGFVLSINGKMLKRAVGLLVALAAGALIGDAFIHLLPESFESLPTLGASLVIILGMLIFFVLEKFLHWQHSHEEHVTCDPVEDPNCKVKQKIQPIGHMILVSDGIHNILDGIIIGAGFLVNPAVGVATTIAVALHEIPQEIGDFGILLHAGYTRTKALFFNFLSSLLALVGALLVLFFGNLHEGIGAWLLPIAAGSFIYIAMADLIPHLHKTTGTKRSALQILMLVTGIAIMVLLTLVE